MSAPRWNQSCSCLLETAPLFGRTASLFLSTAWSTLLLSRLADRSDGTLLEGLLFRRVGSGHVGTTLAGFLVVWWLVERSVGTMLEGCHSWLSAHVERRTRTCSVLNLILIIGVNMAGIVREMGGKDGRYSFQCTAPFIERKQRGRLRFVNQLCNLRRQGITEDSYESNDDVFPAKWSQFQMQRIEIMILFPVNWSQFRMQWSQVSNAAVNGRACSAVAIDGSGKSKYHCFV